jgi:hypothetical protein
LPAVLGFGEHERKGAVGFGVSVVVDIDPVHSARIEVRAGHERVDIDDEHRLVLVFPCRKQKEIRQVEPSIVARELEVGGAEVVGHCRLLFDCDGPAVTRPERA